MAAYLVEVTLSTIWIHYLWTEGEYLDKTDGSTIRPSVAWAKMFALQYARPVRRRVYDRAEQLLALSKGLNMGRYIYDRYFPLDLPGAGDVVRLLVKSSVLHAKTRQLDIKLPLRLRRHFKNGSAEATALPTVLAGRNILDVASMNHLQIISALRRRFFEKARRDFWTSKSVSRRQQIRRAMDTSHTLALAYSELFSILRRRFLSRRVAR